MRILSLRRPAPITFPLAFLCLIAFPLLASDSSVISGKWYGSVDIQDRSSGSTISTAISAQFEQSGAGALSGAIGREGDSQTVAIRNGKVDGDRVTFEAASDETTGPMNFSLRLNGDRMEGRMSGTVDTATIEAAVKLERRKN